MKAASLNLPLDNNLGFAYAIAYKNHKTGTTEAQFQAGYRAFIQLAQRTGLYKKINVLDIRQGEVKTWNPFTEELELVLIEDIDKRETLPVIGYAGIFELLNGYQKITYWPKDRIMKHAKRFSKTFNNGPWQTDFDAMAKKTVLKELISKWGPMSIQLQEAVKFDQSVIRDDGETPDYIDAQYEAADEGEALPEKDLAAEFQKDFEEKMKAEGQL
jgi:recombination protein RecT